MTVGVDGSPSAMRALDWAADEAALHNRSLRIVHASVWERFEGATPAEDFPEGAAEAAALRAIVTDAEARARRRRPGVRVLAEVLPGEPVDVLGNAAEDAFALVVGRRAPGALRRHLPTGSLVPGVTERAACPVVVVGDPVPGRPSGNRRVVLGVGEGTGADAAHVAFALHEAQVRGCDLVAVHARSRQETRLEPPGGNPSAADALLIAAVPDQAARASGVVVHRRVVDGPVHTALPQAAQHADLLVLGVRRRHGMVHRELGPAHHTALRHSPCPVALVGAPWHPRRPEGGDVG